MSTFDGIISEIPEIAIDHFAFKAGRPAPLACFLSHHHSDHLHGLDNHRSPFIYCSYTTRQLLLRLVERRHRVNKEKGILETWKRRYKHLEKLLKPVHLNTPTKLHLRPGLIITFTLIDANHCPGSVMFLLQHKSRTVLYTGDIRAETWWVDGIVRNPSFIPFTHGLKSIDKIYLDTTFASRSDDHRCFPSKAQGIAELLQKIDSYPSDTVFHFTAWCSGFEEVWLALAQMFDTQIHVSNYTFDLYNKLAPRDDSTSMSAEGPSLAGFKFGNHRHPGCLTTDEKVRFHSCQPGSDCAVASSKDTITITPILSRRPNGAIIYEPGASFRAQSADAITIDLSHDDVFARLRPIILSHINEVDATSANDGLLNILKTRQLEVPSTFLESMYTVSDCDIDDLLATAVSFLVTSVTAENKLLQKPAETSTSQSVVSKMQQEKDSQRLTFPYSRHSSYEELCNLVRVLHPGDVYPCTFDKEPGSEEASIQELFGSLCSENTFAFDNRFKLDKEEVHEQKSESREMARKQHNGLSKTTTGEGVAKRRRISAVDEDGLVDTPFKFTVDQHQVRSHRHDAGARTHIPRSQDTNVSILEIDQSDAVSGIRTEFKSRLIEAGKQPTNCKPSAIDSIEKVAQDQSHSRSSVADVAFSEEAEEAMGTETKLSSTSDSETFVTAQATHSDARPTSNAGQMQQSRLDAEDHGYGDTKSLPGGFSPDHSQSSNFGSQASVGAISRCKEAYNYAKSLIGSSDAIAYTDIVTAGTSHVDKEMEL